MTYTWERDSAVGFFYSEDDSLVSYECWNNEIKEYSKGKWKYEDRSGNWEKIVKMKNNWYYWKISYQSFQYHKINYS